VSIAALSPAQTHNTLCNCLHRAGRPRHMNMTPCKLAERILLPPASENSIASSTLKTKVPSKPQFTYAEQHGVMCHKCATQTSTAHLLCGSHVAHKLCTEQQQPCTTCHTPATHISVFIKVLLWDCRRSLPCSDGAAACHNTHILSNINPLTSNDPYSGRTAPLTSKRFILYIYSTNIGTEYFKHDILSPCFSLQNAVCFIILTYLVPVLFTFYIQVC